jgi:hypothetical protein
MSQGKPFVAHRVYTIRPRGMAEFIDVFDRLAMPIQLNHASVDESVGAIAIE